MSQRSLTQQRAEALKVMSPILRKKFEAMDTSHEDFKTQTIEHYHSMGQILCDIAEKPDYYLTEEQKAKHVDPVQLVLRAFAAGQDAMKRAMNFATLYSKADVHRLLDTKSRQSPDFCFQWAHIRLLISIDPKAPNSTLRQDYEKKTRDNAWTPDELANAIAEHYGEKRRSGGRPISIPKTLDGQITQIIEMTDLLIRRNNDVWNGDKHNVFVNIMQQPPTALTPDTTAKVHAIKNRMEALKAAADAQIAMCGRTLEFIETATTAEPDVATAAAKATSVIAKRRRLGQ
jgi:hypothetical protein